MTMNIRMGFWVVVLAAGLCPGLKADIVVDFDSFNDSDLITTQIPGLTFTNTIVFTAGVSLNELEFPPHSGSNVVSDTGGPISISFSAPVVSVGGYFNYIEALTFTGFDSSDNQVASAVSAFSSNDALFGDAGSAPNEFIHISFASGISSITLQADPNGGSFTLDDLTYQPAGISQVPEPKSFWLLLGILALLCGFRRYAHS